MSAMTTAIRMSSSNSVLLNLTYNHIAFPPQLPGKQDPRDEDVNGDLTRRLLVAVNVLKVCSQDEALTAWQAIERTLTTCATINENAHVNKARLLTALKELEPDRAIILHIVEQNAAVMIRHSEDDESTVIFEAFETSATAEQTLAARGALQWDFPGVAASLPLSELRNAKFQESMASFLEKASLEPLEEFTPKSRKAGVEISETRDTVDPAIVTQFFMTLLETKGARVHPQLLRKRIKDDVVWDHSQLPWRRSPYWLLLRVCIQRLLYFRLGDARGRVQYKFLLCTVMAHLLTEMYISSDLEKANFLKVKLCRRLAKLESEKDQSPPDMRDEYGCLFSSIGPVCEASIEKATIAIEGQWNAFKRATIRQIPRLPERVSDIELQLTFPNSRAYFHEIFHKPLAPQQESLEIKAVLDQVKGCWQFHDLTSRFTRLAQIELRAEIQNRRISDINGTQGGEVCCKYATEIETYLSTVGNSYNLDSEQMSIFILTLMELWVVMDKCAILAYPILKKYHPVFYPELLDILLLSRHKDLERLQSIQIYLKRRCDCVKSDTMTIFSGPAPGCFADLYFSQDDNEASTLRTLQETIETASLRARAAKEVELEEVNDKFYNLTEKKLATICTQRQMEDGTHDIRGCSHCYFVRTRRRLKIQVHEDFLPSANRMAEKRAVVFELAMPKAFSAYRNSTWEIMNKLCHSVGPSKEKPECLLSDYSPLTPYRTRKISSGLSLASYTKSYLGTHYNSKRLPADTSMVLMPLGLKFAYFDTGRNTWVREFPNPLSFAHHFTIKLPPGTPLAELYASSSFAADGPGPSSYDTAASISDCPTEITVHEFTAHQGLLAGRNRRWLSILAELGASNVNFSLQATCLLFHHLALQAGPGSSNENDILRVVHVVFKNDRFCRKLIHKIHQHIEMISANWREANYMDIMLTLSIQICALGPPETSSEAHELLIRIRRVTLSWVSLLRNETRSAKEIDTAERMARYCFRSALLCRRTFYQEAYNNVGMSASSFRSFVEATLAMQESLLIDITQLSPDLQTLLIRDVKMASRLMPVLMSLVEIYPRSLEAAIDTAWPETNGQSRKYKKWEVMQSASFEGWVVSTAQATETTHSQVFCYHLLEGHFMIDGKVLGKLPSAIADSEILRDLFQNQRLLAFPSNMPGMSYKLGINIQDHQIHIGYRKGKLIVRAIYRGDVLELVPRNVFGNEVNFDLPASLIFDCVHWLNLRTRQLEVRRKPRIWHPRSGNWKIDHEAKRGYRRTVMLVDPHSETFQLMCQIFRDFEEPRNLTLFQPKRKTLSVELKRMDLSFYVNRQRVLHCKQLQAQVDQNQDAGTWYGLTSMLVLRNPSQRIIICTMGNTLYRRQGMHVSVKMENEGSYGRFIIDKDLGRLFSPPVLRLLYTKAQLHALTSSYVPDTLTGRTGTEEALICLQSACLQPWFPTHAVQGVLKVISNLTPRREYYPKEKNTQQLVYWCPHLTMTIQHDAFEPLVKSISKRSERLSLFEKDLMTPGERETSTVPHLRERAQWRRSIYERQDILRRHLLSAKDLPYSSRDGWSIMPRVSNVREVVDLLIRQPTSLHTTPDLITFFRGRPIIGGYTNKFTPTILEECLSTDLAAEWGGLVSVCKSCDPQDTNDLMFLLGLVAFNAAADMTIIRVMIACFLFDNLRNLSYPQTTSFDRFEMNEEPTTEKLLSLTTPFNVPFDELPEQDHPDHNAKQIKRDLRRREAAKIGYEKRCAVANTKFVAHLIEQWPCKRPTFTGFETAYLDLENCMEAIIPEWLRLYNNMLLGKHIKEVQPMLDQHSIHHYVPQAPPCCRGTLFQLKACNFTLPSLEKRLMQRPGPKSKPVNNLGDRIKDLAPKWWATNAKSLNFQSGERKIPEVAELEQIITNLKRSDCSVRKSYAQYLERSVAALKESESVKEQQMTVNIGLDAKRLSLVPEISDARDAMLKLKSRVCDSISYNYPGVSWLQKGNLWPCLSALAILDSLRSTARCTFGPNMKASLITYGTAITKLQQLIRMQDALLRHDQGRLIQEYKPGHTNWHPSQYPDWLLLEIDSNFLIREDQVTVAREIISPSSGSNSVLQMNMGQGKTSVIMPMVASVLADGKRLTRLIVPKSLLLQTGQILQGRLGGILGREIIHIPFSRQTATTPKHTHEYHKLHNETMGNYGIVLAVPEHILSFKLSGLQRLSDMKTDEANEMIKIQEWLNRSCRDVLDESDFTLAVKTQLIYPSGSQLTVDGHPNRWEVTIMVLSLVVRHIPDLARDYPESIDILKRTTAEFPVAYFLRQDVENALVERIVKDLCSAETWILPIRNSTAKERDAIRSFISQEKVPAEVAERALGLFPDKPGARKNLYLLRGLLVHGILLLCLKKRWNVQYGLHPGRDPMAVPFHAKGVPSDQAEWGHPDVAIIFTCLSFYHQGLTERQFQQSLRAVLTSDDPSTEYDRWVHSSVTLPQALRYWNVINLDDSSQSQEIWRHLRFAIVVINHFLNNFVFPVHARQFSVKITSFRMGCTFVPELNQLVARNRNRSYRVAISPDGRRLSEIGLLRDLQSRGIRILIDAGAYILEMDNKALAKAWLDEDHEAEAGIFFGSDNRAWVVFKGGKKTLPLLATPFAENMENCVVYLDQAHTRGTDLRLPPTSVGALTLGLKQTKDQTVQAAMRLRQLATSQSVTFIAPPEVHRSVMDVCKKGPNHRYDSSDVITWLLDQTCTTNTELQYLYLAQGVDFCRRTDGATSHLGFLENNSSRQAYLKILRRPEQQTLEQLYKPRGMKVGAARPDRGKRGLSLNGKVAEFYEELRSINGECRDVSGHIASSALEEVEQEREVAFEVEEEREIQRPPRMAALDFPGLSASLLSFLTTGCADDVGFVKASTVLQTTELAEKYIIEAFCLIPRLYVSLEFTRTVKLKAGKKNDSFTRPVNWVLFHTGTNTAVVVIPEEAEELIPILRALETSSAYLIVYAAPCTKRMLEFDRLDYYAIPDLPATWAPPSWLPLELGILAGRLYFDFATYESLLDKLYLTPRSLSVVGQETAEAMRGQSKRHLSFLHEWLALRRQGQDVSHTPMGYVCQEWPLRPDHPFFGTKRTTPIIADTGGRGVSPTEDRADSDGELYESDDEQIDLFDGDYADSEEVM